jgi:signal transduction histidine kinase
MDLALFKSTPAEAFSQANGIIQFVVAWLLWRQVHVRREWGLGWMALGMLCASLISIGTPILVTPFVGVVKLASLPLLLQVVIGFASLAAVVAGLTAYCEYSAHRALHVFLLCLAVLPTLTFLGWYLGIRAAGNWLALIVFAYLAWIAWSTEKRFPALGNRQLAMTLLGYPCFMFLLAAFDLDPVHIRYLASSPYTLIGITLLWVTLNRQTQERDLVRVELETLNVQLEQRVHDRTLALEHNLEQLQRAQKQLVQSEKLAALGRLVAGVAHELNTPLGNMRVTATTLNERASEVLNQMEQNKLRKSELQEFLQSLGEGMSLLERGSQRAAELVATFKRVSVDEEISQRRTFQLSQVVQDTLHEMEPVLNTVPLHLAVELPGAIEMDSFPGQLGLVLSNLLQNAVLHGLGKRTALRLEITALVETRDVPGVLLEVGDDGEGMSDEVRKKAFDPYFSTRFGQGGSGLGLYIVYGLVTGMLGGEIVLTSEHGHGTCVRIWLPLAAP